MEITDREFDSIRYIEFGIFGLKVNQLQQISWLGDHRNDEARGLFIRLHIVLIIITSLLFLKRRVFQIRLNLSFWSRRSWFEGFGCWFLVETMAQQGVNKGKAVVARTETVEIPESILAQRIQQFSLTLNGRLMNPTIQRMEALVTNMPKIWKLEDRVVGADLGNEIFQFNFQSEETLLAVLKNVPYHFDGWMVSLVRWEPIISSSYPSAINFWVKVSEIPMHLWEEATLRAVGKNFGLIRDIDVDSGSVYVTVNGFNPMVFQLVIPFAWG